MRGEPSSAENILLIGSTGGLAPLLLKDLQQRDSVHVWRTSRSLQKSASNAFQFDYLRVNRDGLDLAKQINEERILFSRVFFVAAQTPRHGENIQSGVTFGRGLQKLEYDFYMRVNAFGPIRLLEILMSENTLLPDFKAIFFSSKSGSTQLRGTQHYMKTGGDMLYRASKACLNNMIKNIAFDLTNQPCVVVSLHPGFWPELTVSASQSETQSEMRAKRLTDTCLSLSSEHHGLFVDEDLNSLAW